jgi:regulation of enolase protein 1 (concanavalin A-like superfamily)
MKTTLVHSQPLETPDLANGPQWRKPVVVVVALWVVSCGLVVGTAVAAGTEVGPSDRLCFAVAGSPGDAAIVNLTPVLAQGPGNGQLISSDVTSPPLASNVNYGPGTIDPNVAVARIGADGKVCYSNSEHTSVHLVADHLGTIDTAAYTPATPTGAPARTVDTRISFEDEFDGYLRAGWQWVPGDFTRWSLGEVPGTLRIDAASALGEMVGLVRPAPSSDFEITTIVRFQPTSNYQFAGLLVYESPTDFLKFGRAYCNTPSICVGDGLYFDSVTAGNYTGGNYARSLSTSGDIYVRIRAEGAIFTAYYSSDGNNWIRLGSHPRSLATPQIGVIAHQSAIQLVAEFEYFKVNILGQ